MKIEAIHQLEKELQWIFTYVPWRNTYRRQKAVEWTKHFLKDLRQEAHGVALSADVMQTHGLICSFCGRGLPLASTRKRRFCSARCRRRDQRHHPEPTPPRDALNLRKSRRQTIETAPLNRDIFGK